VPDVSSIKGTVQPLARSVALLPARTAIASDRVPDLDSAQPFAKRRPPGGADAVLRIGQPGARKTAPCSIGLRDG